MMFPIVFYYDDKDTIKLRFLRKYYFTMLFNIYGYYLFVELQSKVKIRIRFVCKYERKNNDSL